MRSVDVREDQRAALPEAVVLGLFALSVVLFPGGLTLLGSTVGQVLAFALLGLWIAYAVKLYRAGRLR
jgi:hypothetical protein